MIGRIRELVDHLRGAEECVAYCTQVETRLATLRVSLQDYPEFDALIEWVIAPDENKPLLPLVRSARARIIEQDPDALDSDYGKPEAVRDAVQIATLTDIEAELEGITPDA